MKLSNTQIWYKNASGELTEISELQSCDISFTKSGSRSQWNRSGTYTNETIDTIEVYFKRGYNSELDDLAEYDEKFLKFSNGAFSYQGTFFVNNKINKKLNGDPITYVSFAPKVGTEMEIVARGSSAAGHVDDVEVNGVSVVHKIGSLGVAEIDLTPYVKKSETYKVSKDENGYYVEEWN